jgi:ketosteroid isomerase-like protein
MPIPPQRPSFSRTGEHAVSQPVSLALLFVELINRHDVPGLVSLMSEDHQLVDGLGQVVRGREQLRQGWIRYFDLFPDYRVEVIQVMEEGLNVGLFGTASGTLAAGDALPPANRWSVPLAIRASIRGDCITEWRIYADNEPVRLIMGRREPRAGSR